MDRSQQMAPSPVKALHDLGQSVWLDFIRRSLIESGELGRLVDEEGLRGVTSNPAIFEKAITGSSDYAEALAALDAEGEQSPERIYERLAIEDIRATADVLAPVYEDSRALDGYVSLEVSPHLARDTVRTIAEARRLWKAVDRPNVMIKVPGTREGVPAIRSLIEDGINVNVTLLFARDRYEEVVEAFLAGLEARAASGGDLTRVASVASFFVSRIDTAVDQILQDRLRTAEGAEPGRLEALAGQVAIANAKIAYQRYLALFSGERWERLAALGAQKQRLLWASTSTKNPAYRDVLYVESLIGPETVDTIPPATLEAFRDHGRVETTLTAGVDNARAVLDELGALGIDLDAVTDQVLEDGLRLFVEPFEKLLNAVDGRCRTPRPTSLGRLEASLPDALDREVAAVLDDWRTSGKVRRLWAHDASLWTGRDEASWLGWLGATDDQQVDQSLFARLARDVREEGFQHALVLGMGGSSLCPDVLQATFGVREGYPRLMVLDSTDPVQIQRVAGEIDLRRTLFIVSSKSGTTLEPNALLDFFYDRAADALGADAAGRRFVAITDPGSPLAARAARDGFRETILGVPSIGGRYSALSVFGLAPAAIMGIDVAAFLDRAAEMVYACTTCVPVPENPGVVLGATLGVLGRAGRDKLTFIVSPPIASLGAWLEQLIAESTGKEGKALIPVDREPVGRPEAYGDDRLIAYLRLASAPDPAQDRAIEALVSAGVPTLRLDLPDEMALGQEFFRWEMATAVASAILGINPFDQPDVEASKVATRALTDAVERTGELPAETPLVSDGTLAIHTDARNAADLQESLEGDPSVFAFLRAHLGRVRPGDYVALLAYLPMFDANEAALTEIRHAIRARTRAATSVGFGPRFLHSTGQAYKGGPNAGVFIQITCDDEIDLPVPGRNLTFGLVKAAQARGDLDVLARRQRRAIRVHLGADVSTGLEHLRTLVVEALSALPQAGA